ncbi:MAG: hypothetical protein WBC91_00565 [Phototrophicaceae bacterium]
MNKKTIKLDGRSYRVTIQQNVISDASVPRLIIPAYLPNDTASDILKVCIGSIQQLTDAPYELWVVDNFSPNDNGAWLLNEPNINVILNHTLPIPPKMRRWWHRFQKPKQDLKSWGSYNNAIGLELASAMIPNSTQWVMTLHMDTMVTSKNWLSDLLSETNEKVRAIGVRLDTARTQDGILHILGCLFDYQLFCSLSLDFYPDLPQYDVGDRISVRFKETGYDIKAYRNSLWQPDLIDLLPPASPYRDLMVDRTFDDNDNVFFLHLGRGVLKSDGSFHKGTTPKGWIDFAQEYILN